MICGLSHALCLLTPDEKGEKDLLNTTVETVGKLCAGTETQAHGLLALVWPMLALPMLLSGHVHDFISSCLSAWPVVWCVTTAPAICHVALLCTVYPHQLDMIMGMVCWMYHAIVGSGFLDCSKWNLLDQTTVVKWYKDHEAPHCRWQLATEKEAWILPARMVQNLKGKRKSQNIPFPASLRCLR